MTEETELPLRPVRDADVGPLTSLLHRAYAPLAARGLRFVATHQDERTTRHRIETGECWVAEERGELAGTITWYRPDPASDCATYRRPEVAHFGQFAVAPELQRRGLGVRLLAHAERRAAEEGFTRFACDTAEPAADLIALYERWGFVRVDAVRWRSVNYPSVVLAKRIGP